MKGTLRKQRYSWKKSWKRFREEGSIMTGNGYAGEILVVDLSTQKTSTLSTADYAERFLGGKGIATRIYWEMVPPQTKAFDPENCFICVSGPLAGFTGFASSRWMVCAKSATGEPETFSWGNLGGGWGNTLKQAGYDGIVIQGKAEKPVYLYLRDGKTEIRDASRLWGKKTFEAIDELKSELGNGISVLAIGQAAENLVVFASLLADEGASGSGGMGSVMGSKNLKAIVVAGRRKPVAADPDTLKELADLFFKITRGTQGLFPWNIPGRTRQQSCTGCGVGCPRQSYVENGRRYKLFCQQVDVYRRPALKYYDGWNDVILQATRLCDGYGLDCSVTQAMIEWLIRCWREGILTEKNTGLPMSKIGSLEFVEVLTRKITYREGFGELLAGGTIKAAEALGEQAMKLVRHSVMNRTNEVKDYDPRLILHNAIPLATEPRKPVQSNHEAINLLFMWLNWVGMADGTKLSPDYTRQVATRYWGSVEAGDFTSYLGKALAAKKIQDRSYALESLILCNCRWPGITA
jgi:aldehyde:ferredoxin oxidoreductase